MIATYKDRAIREYNSYWKHVIKYEDEMVTLVEQLDNIINEPETKKQRTIGPSLNLNTNHSFITPQQNDIDDDEHILDELTFDDMEEN